MAAEVHFSINKRKLRDGIRKAVRDSITSKTKVAMGLSEKNLTAETNYGPGLKPDNMSKKKSVKVTITKTKHKGKQKYKVRIEGGKSDLEIPQRYSSPYHAKIGALRKLDARTYPSGVPGREWNYTGGYAWQTPKGQDIAFINK